MIRSLFVIAGLGFVVATLCFAGAAALGGRDFASHGWNWNQRWDFSDRHGFDFGDDDVTREVTWSGAEQLILSVPAHVRFTQAPGPGKMVITGPARSLRNLTIDNGVVEDHRRRSYRTLRIVLTAPKITRFELNGRDRLTIEDFDQETLDIDMSGTGEVTAKGRAGRVSLDMSGTSDADLGDLDASSVDVELSGTGKATIAPRDEATLDISGMGEVTLRTRPTRLSTDVSGTARVIDAAPN